MKSPSAAPQAVAQQQKPGWSVPLLLAGLAGIPLRLAGVRSWWALLWAPLLVLAVCAVVYEWRLLARSRWRMDPLQWVFLVLSHLGLAASLTAIGLATG
ncbi:hypothetical protein ACIRBY_15345 [Streptomyces sp. NPDC096136]|uniref:hypothetical protein n=1 Tax=Streptomyces sp. NPDC096136 TaxID=3366076 RepID=UPI00381C2224